MAKCNWCHKEMLDGVSCSGNTKVNFPAGDVLPPVPNNGGQCHDCNCPSGGFHHPGCDAERCPKCGGRLISCGCLDPEENNNE